jgi:hypothetical protein
MIRHGQLPALANTPSAGDWRTFEVTTRVELLKPDGVSHIWLPAPLIRDTPYQHTISTRFAAEGGTATLTKDKQSTFGIVTATYPATAKPALTLTSRVSHSFWSLTIWATNVTTFPLNCV